MNDEKKLELLEDMMELDHGTLKPEMELDDIDEWNSIAVISFIALVDDEFDRVIKGTVVREQETVADLLTLMAKE